MSAATTYINGLLYDARCFRCLPEATHFEIQTYILSVIAGGSTDPAVLVNQARGLAALSWQSLTEVKVYLLATLAGFDTTPNNLVTGAKCYDCIPPGMLTEVQTYLLAQDPAGPGITDPNALALAAKAFQSLDPHDLLQIQVMLLALIAGLAVDANALIQAAKCMTCFPYTVLIAVEVATIDFLEPIPPTSPRQGRPPPDPPPPPPGHTPPGRGGGIPACTDTLANLTPVVTAHYVAAAITTIDLLVPRTCCKNGHYQVFGANAADMSGAVLVTSGNEPGRTGNWTITGIDVSGAGFQYYAAKSSCTGGLTSPYSNIVLSVDGSAIANDWANRVVTNGGAMPSVNSINACETFVESLMLAGIWSKMIHVNMVAPDSEMAFRTPLLVGTGGNDPLSLIAAPVLSLTVNGALTTAGTGAYQTALNLNTVFANDTSNGVSFYVTVDSGLNRGICGNGLSVPQSGLIAWYQHSTGNSGITDFNIAVLLASSARVLGFQSFNRTANNVLRFYRASSINPFGLVVQDNTVNATARPNAAFFPVWGHSIDGGLTANFDGRCSFFALHLGLTQTEDQALYNAVQALRTTFGGGTI